MPSHVVKRGDNPSSIAKKYTGDETRHPELLAANPAFDKGDGKWKMLKSGDILALPEGWARDVEDARETEPGPVDPEPSSEPLPNALVSLAPPPGARFAPTHTPESATLVFNALTAAWKKLFGDEPAKESIAVLVSQWALETGWGKTCWNWNLGNIKAHPTDGLDHTYYPCWEVLTRANAHTVAANPGQRKDGKPGPDVLIASEDEVQGTAVVWFYPDHDGCRFRAFRSLEAGAEEYLKVLFHRYRRAWASVLIGNPSGFAAALKTLEYFTAPLDGPKGYRTALVSIWNRVQTQLAA
jgi:hypothetical protein